MHSTAKHTLTTLQAALTETAEVIEERRKAFVANPGDVETIHRFRTNTRTLRSLVSLIKPWQNKQQNAETQSILKEVVGYTSLLRELDVLEKHVRTNPDSSPELIAFCAEEASAERSHVLEALTSKDVVRSFKKAMTMAKNVQWKKQYVEHGLPTSAVRQRFDAMVASTKADLATLDLCDAERTHDVRKRAKRARYVAERYHGILGEDAVEIARRMNDHQDNLGDVCDARANIRLIGEFLERDLPETVAQGLARLQAQNETMLQRALKAAGA